MLGERQQTAKPISYQSSKAEIWRGYRELKDLLEKKEGLIPAQEKKHSPPPSIIGKVLEEISRLGLTIGETLSTLGEAFTKEVEKLTRLQGEVEEKKRELKTLYDIEVKASTLESLKKIEEEERVRGEEEKARSLTLCKREEEEYQYKTKLQRQTLEDEFNQLRKKQERELQERKREFDIQLAAQATKLKEQEKELEAGQKELESQAKQLKESFAKAEATFRQEMQEKLNHERELNKQIITSLQDTIARQDKEVIALRQQLQKALEQIKDMAVGALQGQERPALKS